MARARHNRRQRPGVRAGTPAAGTPLSEGGLIIASHGKFSLVEDGEGVLRRCVARRSTGRIVCGDRVTWHLTGKGEGVIESVEQRRTVLLRAHGTQDSRPLAANIDQIIVVTAPQPPLDVNLVDRYILAAEVMGADPVVVINKADLLNEGEREAMQARVREYRDIGYPVHLTSVLSGEGFAALGRVLREHVSILVGQSGVGKSSLAKRLQPRRNIAVGALSDASGLGRHTTTTTMLYHLPGGGDLIDSPGVRDFSLWKVDAAQVADGFREFRPHLGMCRFRDCRHVAEPGCAIVAAVSRGEITARRLASYRNILDSSDNPRRREARDSCAGPP
jgi:ribosome biogenesis GTPase